MKQIFGVIMFAIALISVVFEKPVHPHGIEP